ncbi:MAG: hypothetical protein PWQ70_1134 [Clostridiales bacterium]|jgi:hypothetical protein|nr:hypothetical protein [Clostridiales bacterium]
MKLKVKKSDKSISEIDSEPRLEPSLESASEADLELTASEFTSQPDVEPTLELGSEQLIYNERKEKDEVIASTSCDDLNEADSNDIIVEQTTDFKQNVSDEHNRKQEKYQPNLENNQNSNADNKISIPKWLRPFIIQDNNIDTNYQDDIDIMMNGNAEEVNEMSLNADMDTTLDNEKVENANDFSLNNVEEDKILEEADQSSLGDIQSDDTLNKKSFQNQQNTNHNMNKHTNHIDPLEGLKRICLIHQNLKKQ